MKKLIRRMLAIAMIFSLFAGPLGAQQVQAATKNITAKYYKSADLSKSQPIEKAGAKVKKKGTYNFTIKNGRGFIVFIVPKTGKYKLEFLNLKLKGNKYGSYARFRFLRRMDGYGSPYTESLNIVKQPAGYYEDDLDMAVNKWKDNPMDYPLKKTITAKFKKGDHVYIFCSYDSTPTYTGTGKLVIK